MSTSYINPYAERGMVLDHERGFFGRTRELREVYSRLATMQSISVIGQRRIGKSSFLYRIANPRENELKSDIDLHYIDLQRVFSAEEFYQRACRALGFEDGQTHLDLEDAIQNKRVVFCLDEFEQAYKEDFGSEFFNALRSLAQTGHLALVVASQLPLNRLHNEYLRGEDVTSKFYNIFTRLDLGEFTIEEAKEMITGTRNGIRFSGDEVDLIMKLAGTHPHWLNVTCALVYDARMNGKVEPAEIEKRFAIERGYGRTTESAFSAGKEPVVDRPAVSASPSATSRDVNATLRFSLLLTFLALLIGGFGVETANPVGVFLGAGILLISIGLLVTRWIQWRGNER